MDKQRVYKWAGIFMVLFVVLTQTPLLTILLKFLILGAIPGTKLSIPAWAVLIINPILILIGIHWVRSQPIFIGEVSPPPKPELVPILPPKAPAAIEPQKAPAKRSARATV